LTDFTAAQILNAVKICLSSSFYERKVSDNSIDSKFLRCGKIFVAKISENLFGADSHLTVTHAGNRISHRHGLFNIDVVSYQRK
jgi:hypothetical protein